MKNERKYRIVLCTNYPRSEPAYLYAPTKESALLRLKELSEAELFTSSAYPMPGAVNNIALLEKWDEHSEDWYYCEAR